MAGDSLWNPAIGFGRAEENALSVKEQTCRITCGKGEPKSKVASTYFANLRIASENDPQLQIHTRDLVERGMVRNT